MSNNCTSYESNTEVTILFDSKFGIFAQHYLTSKWSNHILVTPCAY